MGDAGGKLSFTRVLTQRRSGRNSAHPAIPAARSTTIPSTLTYRFIGFLLARWSRLSDTPTDSSGATAPIGSVGVSKRQWGPVLDSGRGRARRSNAAGPRGRRRRRRARGIDEPALRAGLSAGLRHHAQPG